MCPRSGCGCPLEYLWEWVKEEQRERGLFPGFAMRWSLDPSEMFTRQDVGSCREKHKSYRSMLQLCYSPTTSRKASDTFSTIVGFYLL